VQNGIYGSFSWNQLTMMLSTKKPDLVPQPNLQVLEDGDLRYLEDRVHSAEDASISSLGS
jgi:hypothetical protein